MTTAISELTGEPVIVNLIVRKEAMRLGLSRYFTGKPCKHGHVAERFTERGQCCVCNAGRTIDWRGRNKERTSAYAKQYAEDHRMEILERRIRYFAEHIDQERTRKREHMKVYSVVNAERISAYRLMTRDKRIASKKAWAVKNADLVREYNKRNSERILARTKARLRAHKHATPKWLSADQKRLIVDTYLAAQRITADTGVQHDVDHIVPLQGKLVSGLHVPWNLRVVTASLNRSKRNFFHVE